MEQFPTPNQKEVPTARSRNRFEIDGDVFESLIAWTDQEMQRLGAGASRREVIEWVLDNYKTSPHDTPGIPGTRERGAYRRALHVQFGLAPEATGSRTSRPTITRRKGSVHLDRMLPESDQ